LCAGQEVYCDQASIVGSIGVVSGSFGVHDLIERYGVERRVLSAGKHKVRLDPFLPQNPDDVVKMEKALSTIHDVFKAHVRSKRGDKIEKGKEDTVFSGDFWVGKEAVDLGLVDQIGNLHAVAKEKFGEQVVVRDIMPKPRFPFPLPWLGDGAAASSGRASFAAGVMDDALTVVEERLEERVWRSRVGLE
jgi:ClpP class serine protease